MKIPLIVASCLVLNLLVPESKADQLIQSKDRVAFCGDGAADPGSSTYIEAYLRICTPAQQLKVQDFAWSSSTASGCLARLDTDLLPFKPTVVLTNFGLIEAGTEPLTDATSAAYRKAQTDLVEALKKNGVRTVVVGSPKCVDSFHYHNNPAQAAAANKNLSALADIDKEVAAREGVVYADVFGATLSAMTKAKALYGEKYVFSGRQTGSPCSLVTAYAFLKALACSGDIGSITVEDLETGRVKASRGQWLSFADKTMTVESRLFPFWWCNWGNRAPADANILKCVPFDDELNRYVLVVKKLTASHAKVTWGDEDHDFSTEQLEAGINLPKEFFRSPFSNLFDITTHSISNRQQQQNASGKVSIGHPGETSSSEPWDALAQNTLSDLISVVTHSQRQKITIQPLAEVEKRLPGPVPIIVDTDMASDCDDVGALALLNSFMVQGEAKLIACTTNCSNGDSGAVVQAINAYYGHPSIPIGSYQGEPEPTTKMTSVLLSAPAEGYHGAGRKDGSTYTVKIHQRFAPSFPTDDKLPKGVDVYRKALASAADGTVVIVSLGLMSNLQDLIQSQPDSVSQLNGIDLVRKKVRELVLMANTVPEDAYLLSKWPTRMVWTTFIGNSISAGKSLVNTPENNPVRVAYEINGAKGGRQTWDLTASWLAVRGPGDLFDEVSGYWKVGLKRNAYGTWIDGAENHRLAIQKMPYPEVSNLIDAELARPPKP